MTKITAVAETVKSWVSTEVIRWFCPMSSSLDGDVVQ